MTTEQISNEIKAKIEAMDQLIIDQAEYIAMQENIINNVLALTQLIKSPPEKDKSVVYEPQTGRTWIWDGVSEIKPFPQNAVMMRIQDKYDGEKLYVPPSEAKPRLKLVKFD